MNPKTTAFKRHPAASCCLSTAAANFLAAAGRYLATFGRIDPHTRRVILGEFVYPPNLSGSRPTFRAAALAEGFTAMGTTAPAVHEGAHPGCVIAATAAFEEQAGIFLASFQGVDSDTSIALFETYTALYGLEVEELPAMFLAACLAHVVTVLVQGQGSGATMSHRRNCG